MPSEKQIAAVMRILKKQRFNQPVVTEVADRVVDRRTDVRRRRRQSKMRHSDRPFHVLISCLLSLRTRDEIAAKAFKNLFSIANTPEKISKMPIKRIENLIHSANFYKTKAKRINDICKILVREYNSKVPSDFNELMRFKGVGRKTANIVMTYGFGKKDYIAVDTHVHRIPNRLGWIKTKTPEQTEAELKIIIPKRYWHDFNDLFVQFGQNVCKPITPLCYKCPINKYCNFPNKTKLK